MYRAQPVVKTPEQIERLRAVIIERGGDVDDILGRTTNPELWANDRYVATAERRDNGSVAVLSFHRRDRKPIRDWRDMQRIKNEVAGDNVEAVELFPSEERLMDTANEYWLWCLAPGERWPFGFAHREVSDEHEAAKVGAKQRPFAPDPNQGEQR